jgi:hypothetical protein
MRVLAFAALLLLAAPVRAQDADAGAGAPNDPAADDVDRARSLAREGHQAMVESRWDDAYAALDEAYRLAPLPQILVNLAGAELQTGRVRSAIARYEAFLRATTGDESFAPLRPSAEQALEAARARLAHLAIGLERASPGDEVRLDGAPIDPSELPGAIAVDPGMHSLALVRDGRELDREIVDVEPGARVEVILSVPAARPAATRPDPARAPADGDGGSVLASPWLWLSVAVLAIGAGVAIYVLTRDDSGIPTMPNTTPGVITFD